MKHILIVTPFFYPHVGGSQQYMEDMYATILASHKDIAADVLCYNTSGGAAKETYKGMSVYRVPCWNVLPGQFVLPHPVPLLRFLLEHRDDYDLVHASTRFFESSWWVPLYARCIGKKCILTDHCASHPVHEKLWVSVLVRIIDRYFVQFPILGYRRIYATNHAAQSYLWKTYKVFSQVIYGGVNTKIFKPAKQKNHKKLRVLFAGRMIPSKGATMLFSLTEQFPKVEFFFAGPGKLVETFQAELAGKKRKNVHILGSQSKQQIAKLLQSADIFVHPSFHHEGFPNALLEAGASRVAVIATDVGGSKEIIINGKTGLLIPFRDKKALSKALKTLLESKKKREMLAENLYKFVRKQFSLEKVSEQLYEEIKKFF